MADNYVEIRIKASDTAKPDLTDLKVKLDELGHKVETARVDVDDEEAKLKLLDMNAKLAALNRKVANPRVNTASAARAESDIAKLNAEMDKLGQKADTQAQSKGGLLGKLLFGAGGDAGALGGGGGVPSIGGMSLPALLAIVPAIEAALVEATGLVSGFAAAGAGAGAFGLLAMPAFKSVSGALTKISADQQTYNRALTATAKNTALQHLKQDYAALDPAERGAVRGLQGLMGTYHQMAKAFEPQVFKVFNDGLKIANNLLPTITPFANTFANALDGLLKKVGKFTESKGFKDWLNQFRQLEGPAVTAIGAGIGKVAVAIGKLLTIMSKKDVVNSINIAFSVLSGTISAIGYVVKRLMSNWDGMSSAFRRVRHDIASGAHDIAHDFDNVRHAGAVLLAGLVSAFLQIRAAIQRWEGDVGRGVAAAVGWFRSLPGRIRGAVGNLGSLLFSAGQDVLRGLLGGIESMVGSIVSAAANVGSSILGSIKGALGLGSPSRITRQHGVWLAQGLIEGMDSMHSPLGAAAGRMAGGAVPSRYGTGRGGAGAGGTLKVQLEFVGGDDMLLRGLRNAIRVRGGNVQAVLGH